LCIPGRGSVLSVSSVVSEYLDLLDQQRETIFNEIGPMSDTLLWYRPAPKVWSIGEHLDHTRVINCFTRRLLYFYSPLLWPYARLMRSRPYQTAIDDVYKRPGMPMWVGVFWPPRYKPSRPVSIRFLHDKLRKEHHAFRRFFENRDERILGHTVLADPVIGALNLIQWLRVQGFHDAHHYERVHVRLVNPGYASELSAS